MYTVIQTKTFEKWIKSQKDKVLQMRIAVRLRMIEKGNFGDHHTVGDGVSELRIHTAGGIRIYYTIRGVEAVILLVGGDKSTQQKDIEKAKKLAKEF